jgi:hypothetical protein
MNDKQAQGPDNREQTVLSEVLQAIRRVRHGYVQVIVQDGKAIQIDTMEKKRLDRPRT